MGSETIVVIGGHQYRYEYDEISGKTLYRGPVGDAPELSEAEFLKALGGLTEGGVLENLKKHMEEWPVVDKVEEVDGNLLVHISVYDTKIISRMPSPKVETKRVGGKVFQVSVKQL